MPQVTHFDQTNKMALYLSVNLFSTKVLVEMGPTWSREPREGLAVCRAKDLHEKYNPPPPEGHYWQIPRREGKGVKCPGEYLGGMF